MDKTGKVLQRSRWKAVLIWIRIAAVGQEKRQCGMGGGWTGERSKGDWPFPQADVWMVLPRQRQRYR